MRVVKHSPTCGAQRASAVIHHVDFEHGRFDCISDMHKFGSKCNRNNLCEPKLHQKSALCVCALQTWAHSVLVVCFKRASRLQCKGVICQTKFGISDDVDDSSESKTVRVQSCLKAHQTGPLEPVCLLFPEWIKNLPYGAAVRYGR